MSGRSALRGMSEERRRQFLQADLTLPQLDGLMEQFVTDVAGGQWQQKGWPRTAYGTSKAGVTALTAVQARGVADKSILVNCCWSTLTQTEAETASADTATVPTHLTHSLTHSLTRSLMSGGPRACRSRVQSRLDQKRHGRPSSSWHTGRGRRHASQARHTAGGGERDRQVLGEGASQQRRVTAADCATRSQHSTAQQPIRATRPRCSSLLVLCDCVSAVSEQCHL